MKNVLFAFSALIFTATSAYAGPLTCNTNVNNDPRKGNTSVTIDKVSRDHRVEVTMVTRGGIAHFITAPIKFDAIYTAEGPEFVKYENREKGFKLEVNFISMGGKLRGTLTSDVFAPMKNVPVVCVLAIN
ncbi:MAG: hypothetical protein ACXVB9_07080 [Bdellovibrionota bacterium]